MRAMTIRIAAGAAGVVASLVLACPGWALAAVLRKLPPQDTKPGTQWVQTIARTRFPELSDPAFAGMAEVIMVLNMDGSVLSARERVYSPEKLPPASLTALMAEEAELGL